MKITIPFSQPLIRVLCAPTKMGVMVSVNFLNCGRYECEVTYIRCSVPMFDEQENFIHYNETIELSLMRSEDHQATNDCEEFPGRIILEAEESDNLDLGKVHIWQRRDKETEIFLICRDGEISWNYTDETIEVNN